MKTDHTGNRQDRNRNTISICEQGNRSGDRKKENTDLETNVSQLKLGVKVSGKRYKFNLLQNGKIVMNQENTVKFGVRSIHRLSKRRVGIDTGWKMDKLLEFVLVKNFSIGTEKVRIKT